VECLTECTPEKLAELTLALFGPTTLNKLKDTLEEEGLQPPKRWSSQEARLFAEAIGFPIEFADSSESSREAEEYISGPMKLPDLHNYQKDVMASLAALWSSTKNRRRAVVSLPTGGGKTRVTVQAAVEHILKPNSDRRNVLWVAQTDELCEQAVQAFRQVWLNCGAENTELRIVRLWDGKKSPAKQDLDLPVVVVASIQTLNNRLNESLSWLQQPGLIVVDECHHAITKSYSRLLTWLDAEAPRSGAKPKEEPPIIGLSATPMRGGTDGEETERLAARFDRTWFPSDQAGLYQRLLDDKVLSLIDPESLDSGADLTVEEQIQLDKLGDAFTGIEAQNLADAIDQRLAKNEERNQLLLDRIAGADERSILFFANSVAHAREMAVRLNLIGIAAAAIDGSTPKTARRYFLDKFKRQELQVICNHSVLTTGFDAPKTDMIVISRTIFSPVRYMQIVGRGLRGENNGGTLKCRLVTVRDNLGRFSGKHAYELCAKYFTTE